MDSTGGEGHPSLEKKARECRFGRRRGGEEAARPDKEGGKGYNQRDISMREEAETKQGQCLPPLHTSTSTVTDLPLLLCGNM